MPKKSLKIIISIKKVSEVNPTDFYNYNPYGDSVCFELYKMLLNKYSNVFINNTFKSFLNSLFIKDEAGEQNHFFQQKEAFDFDGVFGDDNFNEWIDNEEHKKEFVKKLLETNGGFLIRKHKEEEIYVVPVLNEDYNNENVKYTEALIKALKKDDDDDLWLLLHDRDLYTDNKQYHKADIEDTFGSNISRRSKLKSLIKNNKVFTFYHQSDDPFFENVIKKLNELTLDEIICELKKTYTCIEFAKSVASHMNKTDMISEINDNKELYDFSQPFL